MCLEDERRKSSDQLNTTVTFFFFLNAKMIYILNSNKSMDTTMGATNTINNKKKIKLYSSKR